MSAATLSQRLNPHYLVSRAKRQAFRGVGVGVGVGIAHYGSTCSAGSPPSCLSSPRLPPARALTPRSLAPPARRHKSSILHKPKPHEQNNSHQSDDPSCRLSRLLARLQRVDTAALCDADKTLLARRQNGAEGFGSQDHPYVGLGLMSSSIRPRNYFPEHCVTADGRPCSVGDADGLKMLGPARTVQCTRPNDFLAVLRGLDEAKPGEVLVVNTLDSHRAVAGGLFLGEAARKSLGGIVVDGYVRDVAQIAKHGVGLTGCLMYSSGVTPYAGTVQSVGETQVTVICGGVKVSPGDVVMGDGDGVLVGSVETFEQVVEVAENIVAAERTVLKAISQGVSLHSMTNFREHFDLRKTGKESALDFRKTRLVSFEGVKHVDGFE